MEEDKEEMFSVAHHNVELDGWVCNCGAGGKPFGLRYSNQEMRRHLRYAHLVEGPIVSLGARDVFMYANQPVSIWEEVGR